VKFKRGAGWFSLVRASAASRYRFRFRRSIIAARPGLFGLRQVHDVDAAVLAGERVSRFLQPGLAVTAMSRVSGVIPWRHARRAFTASAGFSGNCWL
jgi:hypothetical protein